VTRSRSVTVVSTSNHRYSASSRKSELGLIVARATELSSTSKAEAFRFLYLVLLVDKPIHDEFIRPAGTAKILGIDPGTNTVAFQERNGSQHAIKVKSTEMKKFIRTLQPGRSIEVQSATLSVAKPSRRGSPGEVPLLSQVGPQSDMCADGIGYDGSLFRRSSNPNRNGRNRGVARSCN
jgi:hypothetical protein